MTSTDRPISQAERAELRAVIRARTRALKSRIAARKADQRAEVERRINLHYKAQTAVYQEAQRAAMAVLAEANKTIADIYAPIVGEHPEWAAFGMLVAASPPDLERQLMRARADREVEAAAKAAETRLILWEAEALETVARSGIASEDALAMLDQMSSIEMLMPMIELPQVAEGTIDEMAADEGKTPYFQRSPEQRALTYHAKEWRRRAQLTDVDELQDPF